MGAFYDSIPNQSILTWLKEQKLFLVATAPLSPNTHVNLSPKGHDSIRFDNKTAEDEIGGGGNWCWYVDMTGSGNETLSCLKEKGNGRITLLFMAFEGPPRIVRLFGKGTVYERGSKRFNELLPPGDPKRYPGTRSIIWIDITKVGTSCGYSVPFFKYVKERTQLLEFMQNQETNPKKGGMLPYWELKNKESIDGLKGLDWVNPTSSNSEELDDGREKVEEVGVFEWDKERFERVRGASNDSGESESELKNEIGGGGNWKNELSRWILILTFVYLIGWLVFGLKVEVKWDLREGLENRRRVMGLFGI